MLDEDQILAGLTAPQREAVTHLDGPMLVVAGAGSGKTRVVTHRVIWLVAQGVWPGQILALTFTNKAAREMRSRIEAMIGGAPPWMGTFHSVCARLLRQHLAGYEGDPRNDKFTIYDDDDQKKLVKLCLEEAGLDPKDKKANASKFLSRISAAKNKFQAPGDYLGHGLPPEEAQLSRRIYELYERRLRQANALDFDDLLVLTVRMLEGSDEIRAWCHQRFRYLLVDEYQDTNHVQYLLLKLLAGDSRNVHVTGDPDQSIYSWRGAQYRNIMEFSQDYPQAKVVKLEQNYRSCGTILAVANALIEHNRNRIPKRLFTERDDGDLVTVARFASEREEARWIGRQIQSLRDHGISPREVAVFYRTNAQSRPLEDAMMDSRIPYQLIGGIRFYERREIKDIVAYLRLFVNPDDALALERLLESRSFGVGATTFARVVARADELGMSVVALLTSEPLSEKLPKPSPALQRFAAWLKRYLQLPQDHFAEFIQTALEESGLPEHYRNLLKKDAGEASRRASSDQGDAEERLENLNSFLGRAAEFAAQREAPTLAAFLEEIALNSSADEIDDGQDKATLMTLHCSKGLEFPYVFIAGVEQGLLPHVTSYNEGNEEEERRLLYVGITRAEKKLFISYASSRFQWGETKASRPSVFIGELPEELLFQYGGARSQAAHQPRPWWQEDFGSRSHRGGWPRGGGDSFLEGRPGRDKPKPSGDTSKNGDTIYDYDDL